MTVLYILIFRRIDMKRGQNREETDRQKWSSEGMKEQSL
jgi:hypothetical protein